MHQERPLPQKRIAARNDGLRRLQRLTLLALAVAGSLATALGVLAARAVPGRSGKAGAVAQVTTQAATQSTAPPPLVPVQGASSASAPPPPVSTQAPPVVSSGGS
ncbi:MAG: hypothetical protein ACYDBR_02965 [Gaiellaceae bacterium]